MIENLGVSKHPGTVMLQFRVASNILKLSKIGRHYYFFINDRAVAASKSEKELNASGITVIAAILKSMIRKSSLSIVKCASSNGLNDIVKKVTDNLRPSEIEVLSVKPDEIEENTAPTEPEHVIMASNFQNYRSYLRQVQALLVRLQESSQDLLNVHLSKDMWGSKDVSNTLNDIKASLSDCDFEHIESLIERSNDPIVKMAAFKETQYNKSVEAAGHIIGSFSEVKTFLSKLAETLNPLYSIDTVFKNRLGYPATFFYSSSNFLDFLSDYESLVDSLVKTASIEKDLIEPLFVMKVKAGVS
jgi:hypothetical protein